MKTKAIFAVIVLVFSNLLLFSQEEFKKSFEHTFTPTGESVFKVENKYGDINIENHQENTIEISVEIVVKSKKESTATEIFESIDIQFNTIEDTLLAITNIVNTINGNKKFEINYTIKMPSTIRLVANNRYGNIFINEMKAHTVINLKYGNLKAKNLTTGNEKPRSIVNLSYSDAVIIKCDWLKINAAYSGVEINESEALIIISKYSKFEVTKANSIVVESKYDSPYSIGELANFICDGRYSKFKIEKLTGKLEADLKYSQIDIESMPTGFESVDIELSFSEAKIEFGEDADYSIEAFIKSGELNTENEDNLEIKRDDQKTQIKGTVGAGKTTSKVTIAGKFSTVSLD